MNYNNVNTTGGMPPANPLPENSFQVNSPPYPTNQNPSYAPMSAQSGASIAMGHRIYPAAPAANTSGTTYVPVMMQHQVGSKPTCIVCRSCNQQITTIVESKTASKTHLFALGLCLIGCWLCCCIPYCMDSCMNIEHYCPNCNAYIGVYSN